MIKRIIGLIAFMSLAVAMPVQATQRGVVLDDRDFRGGIPDGYTGSSDFRTCEFRRGSQDGVHFQRIYGAKNDRCTPPTTGAPGKGDVSIYQRFPVNPGEWYKAWARAEMYAPNNTIGVVKLIFRTNERMIAECYGKITSTELQNAYTGEFRYAPDGYARPERSDSYGCKVPEGVVQVAVHYRIRSLAEGSSGKTFLYHLRFGRCRDNGDCSNIPAP